MQSLLKKVKYWIVKPQIRVPVEGTCPTSEPFLASQPCRAPEQMQVTRDGTVTIANGGLLVTDPDEQGDFATIEIPNDERITVTVSNARRVGRVILREGQKVDITLHHLEPTRQMSSQVTKDAMEVITRISVTPGARYSVQNMGPAKHVVLTINAEVIYPDPVLPDKILSRLQLAGYQGEVDEQAVQMLANTRSMLQVVTVRGVSAIPEQPERYVRVTSRELFDETPSRNPVHTVPMGTTVAIVESGLPGVPGTDVYGNPVEPPRQSNLTFLGDGITVVGGRVVALRSGQLLFTKSRIDVVPELVLGRDVSSKDGQIQFDGNVVVYGSVLDGSFIEASGTVSIRGSVLCSTVIAERGALIDGAIVGSQVVVGQSKILYQALHPMLGDLLAEFEGFRTVHSELVARARTLPDARVRITRVADLLISKRHQRLETFFQTLCSDANHLSDKDHRYLQIVQEIRSKWMGIGRTRIHVHDVDRLYLLIRSYVEYVESVSSASPATLQAEAATSSTVRASGNIRMTGMGTYASFLEAGGAIRIRGHVRGGFLVANSTIRIQELGTPTGTESSARVLNSCGKIVIETRNPNTLLQVGNRRDRNLELQRHVVLREEMHG